MLCPPITERSWEPITVEEDQKQKETKEEEDDDNMKALSCMDRVRSLNNLSFLVSNHYYSTEEHILGKFCLTIIIIIILFLNKIYILQDWPANGYMYAGLGRPVYQ